MFRPQIKIELTTTDKILEIIAGIALVYVLYLLFTEYSQLPAQIPIHFDIKGQPDSYSSKSLIFLMPGISLVLYGGMTAISYIPHHYNYPFEITEENAKYQYRIAVRLIRFIKTTIMCIFGYLTVQTINIAKEKAETISELFIVIALCTTFGGIIYYLYKAVKGK